jgi:hypothetical protein
VNGRDKVICVNKLEANEVEKKVGLEYLGRKSDILISG